MPDASMHSPDGSRAQKELFVPFAASFFPLFSPSSPIHSKEMVKISKTLYLREIHITHSFSSPLSAFTHTSFYVTFKQL
jgi:hypothetical protein